MRPEAVPSEVRCTSTFPSNSTNARNYWVDVMFSPRTGAATVPAAPTGVTATPGKASASVSWTTPPDGGSAVTSYTVTPYIGTTAQTATTVTGNPPATTAIVSGLTNGTTYTFTVAATNAVGTGAASAASNAVIPSATAWVNSFDRLTQEPIEFIGAGDQVLVEFIQRGWTAGSDVPVELRTWSVSTVKGGNFLRTLLFQNRNDALEAAGLSE